jgi:hypothetical protein
MLPELSEGEPDTPSVRLAFRLGDDGLGIQHHVAAGPKTRAHFGAQSQRVGGIALRHPVDARLTSGVVIGIRRQPDARGDVAARVAFDDE